MSCHSRIASHSFVNGEQTTLCLLYTAAADLKEQPHRDAQVNFLRYVNSMELLPFRKVWLLAGARIRKRRGSTKLLGLPPSHFYKES